MDASAIYRYYTTDLLTNEILAEIPFQGVNWGRAIRRAGEFSGSIPVIAATAHLDLYKSTMPGRTGLYVVRDGKCVWGGIIWAREYSASDRTLSVSGAEFISYFYHRFVWKTLVDRSSGTPINLYTSSEPVQIGTFSFASGLLTMTTRPINLLTGTQIRPHFLAPGDSILINKTGYESIDTNHEVYEVVDDTTFTVLLNTDEAIPLTTITSLATVTKSTDTYKFVRDLIARTANDFAGLDIPRNAFLPGLSEPFSVVGVERENEISRITLDEPHDLVLGQEVVVQDVGDTFDGRVPVSGIPSNDSFEYVNAGQPDVAPAERDGLSSKTISAFSVTDKTVTITTVEDHGLSVGDEVEIDAGRPLSLKSVTDADMDIFDETEYVDSVLDAKRFTYTRQSPTNNFWYFQRNIVKRGLEYEDAQNRWVVKLETETPHNYLEKGKVKVQGLGIPYDGEFEILSVPTPTQLTYLVDRSAQIVLKQSRGGVVTMTTKKSHGILANDTIRITGFGDPDGDGYNGDWTVSQRPDSFRFMFKKSIATQRNLSFDKGDTIVTINSSSSALLTGLDVGMTVACDGLPSGAKITQLGPNGSNNKFKIDKAATGTKSVVSRNVTASNNSSTLTVANISGLSAKMLVRGTGIPSGTVIKSIDKDGNDNGTNNKVEISNKTTQALNGTGLFFETVATLTKNYKDTAGTIISPPSTALAKVVSDVAFEEAKKSRDEVITLTNTIEIKGGGFVRLGPRVYITTYGGFEENSDIGITVSEETDSGVLIPRKEPYLGSNLQSIGEILEEVSAGPQGFEYRIDCGFDATTKNFTRTLVLSGYDYPVEEDQDSAIRSIQALGADKYVFDYPGNIASFSLSESAENAATRFWITGSDESAGEGGSQPMAGATSERYLRDGWPVLDATEQMDVEVSSDGLFLQAFSFLNESLPPIDELSISVNGSLDPKVGTYAPGDWCSLVFDDEFIKLRLASDQEPRDDILVRKIYAFSVDVPDAYGIPETVELELIRDEEVEYIGD